MKRTDPRVAIADPFRAPLGIKLEALVAAATSADEQSWSSLDWPVEPLAPNFGVGGDAIVAMREDLRDVRHAPYVPIRALTLDFDPVRVAIQMLDLARPERDCISAPDLTYYVRHLEQLARAHYALIVVTRELRLPRLEGTNEFETGRVDGAALLFDLATCELRAGFGLHVENRWEVTGNDRTIEDKLRGELEARFSRAVITGIRERFPLGTPPATLGYV